MTSPDRSVLQPAASRTGRNALILADGFRLQYRVLRCAAECFEQVFVLGTRNAAGLRFSRACRRYFVSNQPFDVGQIRAVDQINALCRAYSIDLVLPSCPATTRFVSEYGSAFHAPHFPVPERQAFDRLNDKWEFARLCERIGVPVPKTRRFETRAQLISACELEWPVVVKPLAMWGSLGVAKAEKPAELEPDGYEPLLVQGYVAGEDLCAFYLCSEGRVLVSLSYVKRGNILTFLSTPDIDRSAEEIISHVGCSGVIGFDIRRKADGSFFFIECNPRFWYRMEVAALAGLNFVALGCGLPETARATGRIAPGTTARSPKALLASALMPWRLSDQDLRMIRYLAHDPIPSVLALSQKIAGRDRAASGRSLP